VAWFAHIGGFAAGWLRGMMNRGTYKASVDQYVEEQNTFQR
jgi:membrane associated rhomboid family serine protease